MLNSMKAFLASSPELNETQLSELLKLVGKEKADKVLVITTAVVPYGLDPRPDWVDRQLEPLQKISNELVETTLEDGDFSPEDLTEYDFVFVSGGNTFYLAYRLQETGWDKKLTDFINGGSVYAGSSAGSIVLMGNIEHFSPADDPAKAPKICSGLSLIQEAVIPHADSEKYKELMGGIADNYRKEGYEVIALNDDQVFVIDGEEKKIV
jgi:dipeptidase E